jgi:hypothetical protein
MPNRMTGNGQGLGKLYLYLPSEYRERPLQFAVASPDDAGRESGASFSSKRRQRASPESLMPTSPPLLAGSAAAIAADLALEVVGLKWFRSSWRMTRKS